MLLSIIKYNLSSLTLLFMLIFTVLNNNSRITQRQLIFQFKEHPVRHKHLMTFSNIT